MNMSHFTHILFEQQWPCPGFHYFNQSYLEDSYVCGQEFLSSTYLGIQYCQVLGEPRMSTFGDNGRRFSKDVALICSLAGNAGALLKACILSRPPYCQIQVQLKGVSTQKYCLYGDLILCGVSLRAKVRSHKQKQRGGRFRLRLRNNGLPAHLVNWGQTVGGAVSCPPPEHSAQGMPAPRCNVAEGVQVSRRRSDWRALKCVSEPDSSIRLFSNTCFWTFKQIPKIIRCYFKAF